MYYEVGRARNEGKQTAKRIETLAEIFAGTEIHFGE